MRPEMLHRIMALILVPALILTSVSWADAQAPENGHLMVSRPSGLCSGPALFGLQALASPVIWVHAAWARGAAFLVRRQVRIYAAGIFTFIAFESWWTGFSSGWSTAGPWHLLAALEVTGLLTAAISNVINQTALSRRRQRFDKGFLVRQMAGASLYYTPVEAFFLYSRLLPQLPRMGMVSASIVQSTIWVLVLTPLLLNLINIYGVSRIWDRKTHARAMRDVRNQTAQFSVFTVTLGLLVGMAAFAMPTAVLMYAVLSGWEILYLILLFRQTRPESKQSGLVWLQHLSDWYRRQPWMNLYVPLVAIALLGGALAALTGHTPILRFWATGFPALAGGSWGLHSLWQRFAQRQIRLEAEELKDLVDDARFFKGMGDSPIDLVIRLRVPMEKHYSRLVFWSNQIEFTHRLDSYEGWIRQILGPESQVLTRAELLNTDFPRLVYDYLDRCSGLPSDRLMNLMAEGLGTPETWPELHEDTRYGLLFPAQPWRGPEGIWPDPEIRWLPPPVIAHTVPTPLHTLGHKEVHLKVEPLRNEDREFLRPWLETPRQSEVVYDLELFLDTGLKPGEYGYKLVDENTGRVEGFVLLFNAAENLHLHIFFANPFRKDKEQLRGVGRELTRLAILDALARRVPLTTFPMNAESLRSFLSLDFKRLSVEGTHVAETWCLWPQDMEQLLRQWNDPVSLRLPPAETFYALSALRPDRSLDIKLNRVSYKSLEPVLYSRRLRERFASRPQELLQAVRSYLPPYFERQDSAPDRFFILDEDPRDPNRLRILAVDTYKRSLSAKPAPAASQSPATPLEYKGQVALEAARPEDLPRLIEFRNVYFVTKTSLEALTGPEDFLMLIVTGQWPGYVFVAKDEAGDILGYAMTYLHPAMGYGEVEEIATNPAKRIKGLGGQLFDRSVLAAQDPGSAGARFNWKPIRRMYLMDYSILGQTAKLGLKRGFSPVADVDKLYVREFASGDSPSRTTNGFWRWRRPGFAAGDPRHFPKELVPKLMAAASQHRSAKDREKSLDDYRYILMFRPLQWRARWGVIWTYLRSWIPAFRFIAPVLLLTVAVSAGSWLPAAKGLLHRLSAHGDIMWAIMVPVHWLPEFSRRIRAAATQWKARRVMPQPDMFVQVMHSLAEEVDRVLDASRTVGPDGEKKWFKRRDSLILLGQLAEGWTDPSQAASIRLVATISKSDKVSHWLLHMANDEIGPAWAHVVTRTNPKRPRVKITFWRDGMNTERQAALVQYRIGWDEERSAHVDAVRGDRPSTADKAWVIHLSMAAFERPHLARNAIHNGLGWVRGLARQTAAFPRAAALLKPNRVFCWIRFPGQILPLVRELTTAA